MKKKITALLVLILLGSCNWFLPKPGGTKHLDCKILNYTLKIYQTSKNIENEVLNLSAVASLIVFVRITYVLVLNVQRVHVIFVHKKNLMLIWK